jgi:hypothetical protein
MVTGGQKRHSISGWLPWDNGDSAASWTNVMTNPKLEAGNLSIRQKDMLVPYGLRL